MPDIWPVVYRYAGYQAGRIPLCRISGRSDTVMPDIWPVGYRYAGNPADDLDILWSKVCGLLHI